MTDEERSALQSELSGLRQELSRCKQELIAAGQSMAAGELLAGVAHEINTPVGSILSNNEVGARSLRALAELVERSLAEETPLPPKAARILRTLQDLNAVDRIACERILGVVRDLRSFAGGGKEEFAPADVNEILQDTVNLARYQFRRRIEVETDYGDLPSVECDRHQLGQVFLNLLVNAGHAIEGKGTIRIKTEREGDLVHISIADTGRGIAPEHREKVFTSGFTTKPSGTGRGLAISREIVLRHHGAIDFEGETGRGTTFHIRIPLRRKPGAG